MIEIRGLKKSFADKRILDGVNLDVASAKTTVIFGLSGSGKSTIIKHIVGLLKPDDGSIKIDGQEIVSASEEQMRRMRTEIGFLFQSGALFDSMNVYENVAFPLREHTKMGEAQIKEAVFDCLDKVALNPNDVANLAPDELSGGMRKRVGLARTIILRPKIMLYDEPTTGLDPIIADQISRLIIKLQEEFHTTSVLISHDINEAFKCADYCSMLFDGKIIEACDAESFQQSDDKTIQAFLRGDSNALG